MKSHLFALVFLTSLAVARHIFKPQWNSQNAIFETSISPSERVHESLILSSIIPEVLDDFTPIYSLNITYPSSHSTVQLGNDIPVSSAQEHPVFEFHSVNLLEDNLKEQSPNKKNATYTLILTDPDAKSRQNPKWSEMCHWIVTNLSLADTLSSTGIGEFGLPGGKDTIHTSRVDELVPYLPPGPPPKTGKHRYVFVLLKGDEGANLAKPKERRHWGYHEVRHGVRDWADENGLEVVGANWFYALNKKQ